MLIAKRTNGDWRLKGLDWTELRIGKTVTRGMCEAIYGALYKLMRYEDIGFEPDEVSEMAERTQWIPIEEMLPVPGEYVLVSFENWGNLDIGRYEDDDKGGAFYPGDETYSYLSKELIVNAWMPLPERYKG